MTFVREPSLSNSTTKKVKNLMKVIMESGKARFDLGEVGFKKRKMDARAFKSLFKRQRVKEVLPDISGELNRPNNISHSCNGDIGDINPETVGRREDNSDGRYKRLVGKTTDLSYDEASNGNLQKSICNSRGTNADRVGNENSIDSNHVDNAVSKFSGISNGDGLKNSRTNLNTTTMDDSENLFRNSSPAKNMDVPESRISADMARAQHRVLSSETAEKFMQAQGSTRSRPAAFLEYWAPVQISKYQLELYCDTLVCNFSALCSNSRCDSKGALSQALFNVRKCCAHPYLLDSSIQEELFAEQHPAAEILDVGIKCSGKLHLLDLMLSEIKNQGLQVLILFQMFTAQGGVSIGDILDDFLRQRFGVNSFERVDASVIPSKKQTVAAVNRFNKKETDQFVFLSDTRACSSAFKFSSLDLIIIYDSDWDPANDLKAIQKISIDSKDEQINVFRLYSSFTVEEKALVLAKQNTSLDNNVQNLGRATINILLMWGAPYLFGKLDEYLAENNNTGSKISSGQSLLDQVMKEFKYVLSKNFESIDSNPLITKGRLDAGIFIMDSPMLGEAKIPLKNEIEPHIFWKKLLTGKEQPGNLSRGFCPRNCKRIQCVEGLTWKSCTENVNKKHESVVNGNVEPASVQVELMEHKVSRRQSSEGDDSAIISTIHSQSFQIDAVPANACQNMLGENLVGSVVDTGESDKRVSLVHEDKEMTKLFQILELPEDMEHTVKNFLEYVIKNHDISTDSPTIMQALRISACWIAALISKQKFDKKHSFHLAKTHLNYQCTEEQAISVYTKMQPLKWIYLRSTENSFDPNKHCLLADEEITEESSVLNEDVEQFSLVKNFRKDTVENSVIKECTEVEIPLSGLKINGSESEVENKVTKLRKKCEKKMKKLLQRHKEDFQELQRTWENERIKLEGDHKLASAVMRSIHGMKTFKLKLLDDNFAKKMEEHNLLKDIQLKDLNAKHLAAWKEERQNASDRLAGEIACSRKLVTVDVPPSSGSQQEDDPGYSELNTNIVPIIFQQQPVDQNPSKSVCEMGDNAAPADKSVDVVAEHVSCTVFAETMDDLETVDSPNEVGIMSIERSQSTPVELVNQLTCSNIEEFDSVNLHISGGQISDEIQSMEIANEVLNPVALSTSFDTRDPVASLNCEVNQRDEPDESINVSVSSPGQLLAPSEQIPTFPDHHESSNAFVPPEQQLEQTQCPVPGEQLDQVSVDTSLSCSHSPPLVIVNPTQCQRNSPSLPVEAGETEDIPLSPSCENIQCQNHMDVDLDLDLESIIAHERSFTLPSDNIFTTEAGRAVVLPNQATEQSNAHIGHAHGSIDLLSRSNNQFTFWNSNLTVFAEPLQHELEKLGKEAEKLEKKHRDLRLQLKLDYEKERQEILHQLYIKYESKVQGAEAEFKLKINEIDKNHNKIILHKSLAEAFRLKCSAFKPSDHSVWQQASPSGFLHNPQQSRPSIRISPGASTCQPFSSQHNTYPPPQAMHQHPQQLPLSIRISPGTSASQPFSSQQNTYPPPQVMRQHPQQSPPSIRISPGASASHQPFFSRQNLSPPPQAMHHQLPQPPPPSVRVSSSHQNISPPTQAMHHQLPQPPPPSVRVSSSHQNIFPPTQALRHQLPQPPPPSVRVSSSHQHISPPTQAMHQLYMPSMRPSTISSQNVIAPPAVQTLPLDPVFSSGTLSRPPMIACVTPATNHRVGGDVRSRAPHLQPFRPPPAPQPPMVAPPTYFTTTSHQHTQPMLPACYPVLVSQPPTPPPTPAPSPFPVAPNFVISALELLQVPVNHPISHSPDFSGSMQATDFVITSSNLQDDQPPSELDSDVVCLSDG